MDARLDRSIAQELRHVLHPLEGSPTDLDPLLALAGEATLVFLGASTYGTRELHRARAAITRRLIRDQGFAGVALEADWTDALRVDRFVRGRSAEIDAENALGGFVRFPAWPWRNTDVLELVGWLRAHDDELPEAKRAGVFGLDVHSLDASAQTVLDFLRVVDPDAARRAERRFATFDHVRDGHGAGHDGSAALRLSASCEAAVVRELEEMLGTAAGNVAREVRGTDDEPFLTGCGKTAVRGAERYYRAMFRGRAEWWNLREQHLCETLGALQRHLEARRGVGRAKLVVWAHDRHIGDARETQLADEGLISLGQLARERWGRRALLVGLTTYSGTVTAAADWDTPAERMVVRAAPPESVEALLHDTGTPEFLLDLRRARARVPAIDAPRPRRSIGVVYRPESERLSHCFQARLARQLDVVLHFDHTRAVTPLERSGVWERGEMELPAAYPAAANPAAT